MDDKSHLGQSPIKDPIEDPGSLFTLSAESNHRHQLGKLKSHNKRDTCHPCKSPSKRMVPKKKPTNAPFVAMPTDPEEWEILRDIFTAKVKEAHRFKSLYNKQEKELKSLRNTINCMDDELDQKESLVDDLKDQIYSIENSEEEWIGRTLKFQYLSQQIKRVGMNQSEDIIDCFDDIEVPEVPISIRDKFIPTLETDNTEYVNSEDEDEHYGFIQDNTEDIITEDINHELLEEIISHNELPRFQGFNVVSNYEDTTVFPDGPELPWYESRYPTLLEISSATRIQRFYRNRFNTNNNIIEDWDEGIDHPEQHPIRTQADRTWFIPIEHPPPHQRHLLLHQQINNIQDQQVSPE